MFNILNPTSHPNTSLIFIVLNVHLETMLEFSIDLRNLWEATEKLIFFFFFRTRWRPNILSCSQRLQTGTSAHSSTYPTATPWATRTVSSISRVFHKKNPFLYNLRSLFGLDSRQCCHPVMIYNRKIYNNWKNI